MTPCWPGIMWTEAGQVKSLLDWPAAADDGDPPDRYFDRLRARGRGREAACFLAMALPRYEAVQWAAGIVRRPAERRDPAILASIDAWLRDPSETHRRSAHRVARAERRPSAEGLCAWAAFLAGGSTAPEGQPPYPAPRSATGRFVAAAVIAAVTDTARPCGTTLDAALDAGLSLAEAPRREMP